MTKIEAEQIISKPSTAKSLEELNKAITINLDNDDDFFNKRAKEVITAKAVAKLILTSDIPELAPILLIILSKDKIDNIKKIRTKEEDEKHYYILLIEEIANILQDFSESSLMFIAKTCVEARIKNVLK